MTFVTPDLCDAHPEQVRVLPPLLKNFGAHQRFHGEVVTVKCFEDNSVVKENVAKPGEGRVMVVDGGGSMRCALLGDQLAEKAVNNGWAGIIINGCIRDVDDMATMALGVQAIASIPLKSTRRGEGQLNIPIAIGGVEIAPGDYIYADNNGVVVSSEALEL